MAPLMLIASLLSELWLKEHSTVFLTQIQFVPDAGGELVHDPRVVFGWQCFRGDLGDFIKGIYNPPPPFVVYAPFYHVDI